MDLKQALGLVVLAIAPTAMSASAAKEFSSRQVTTTTEARLLPRPTGPLGVGRLTVHWVDRSRVEPLDPERRARELMVDVWYPADSGTDPAEYFDVSVFDDPRVSERLRGYFRQAYDAIKAGLVRTHATERAPFARSVRRSPVLIFSHGGGEIRETYTVQMEDLASHGYVVAAVTHTYDAALASFPDGRRVTFAPQRWAPFMETLLEGTPAFRGANPEQWQWWAEDIRFVLNELSRNNRAGSSLLPFAGRLDLARVGVFGHSAGGFAAATACQLEKRIKACLNQDGLSGRAPYHLDAKGWGMDQAFMLIVRASIGPRVPPDDELAAMKLTRGQALELAARMDARQDATLRNTGKGSYRITLQSQGTTHADFGDLPFLQSRDIVEADTHARILNIIRRHTRAFFDKTLRGRTTPLLDDKLETEFVEEVESFPPATRRP